MIIEVEDPAGIKFTLTMTLSLRDWVQVREALQQSSKPLPVTVTEMKNAISSMINQAQKTFIPDEV